MKQMIFYKKQISTLLSLFLPLGIQGADSGNKSKEIAQKAEILFQEQLYDEAIAFYLQLFSSSEGEEQREWAARLGFLYMEEGQPEKALEILSSVIQEGSERSSRSKFYLSLLTSRCLAKIGLVESSLDCLDSILSKTNDSFSEALRLEKAFRLHQLNRFEEAQETLNAIISKNCFSPEYPKALILQAQIFLLQKKPKNSLETLLKLQEKDYNTPLFKEIQDYLLGWTYFFLEQEERAQFYFESLASHKKFFDRKNYHALLQGLSRIYLKQAEGQKEELLCKDILLKAQTCVQTLLKEAPCRSTNELAIDFYLIQSKKTEDEEAYAKALALIEKQNTSYHHGSEEKLEELQLKKAFFAPSAKARRENLTVIASKSSHSSQLRSKVWLLIGKSNLEDGIKAYKSSLKDAKRFFISAKKALKKALAISNCNSQKASIYHLRALASLHLADLNQEKQNFVAWQHLKRLITDPTLFSALRAKEEVCCLWAIASLRLKEAEKLKEAQTTLNGQATEDPLWKERFLNLRGRIAFELDEREKAEAIYEELSQPNNYPASTCEAEFWKAILAAKKGDKNASRQFFYSAFNQDSESPFAPLAYFYYYSYREYMEGHKKAIKHLEALPKNFPSHPVIILGYYLQGLYYKKDHSMEGKINQRKDLTKAIEAFYLSELAFDHLEENKNIPLSEKSYYFSIRTKSALERAKTHILIAKTSKGGKKEIYLKYGEELLRALIARSLSPPFFLYDKKKEADKVFCNCIAEAHLELATLLMEKEEWQTADEVLEKALDQIKDPSGTADAKLSKIWLLRGKIAQFQKKYKDALHFFSEAEESSKRDHYLSPDEKLSIWIEESHCLKALGDYDQAMKMLSCAINAEVISPVRVEAMYLRAELYELEGRRELAIKQLQACAKKGGKWAQKAQKELEEKYEHLYDTPDTPH